MVLFTHTRAALLMGVCLGAMLLMEGSAAARSTSSSTWGVRPKTFQQYLSLCKNRPDIPACRRASFYFGQLAKKGKLSSTKQFYYTIKLHLALRKARQQKMAQIARRDRDQSYWRQAWKRARFKMMALRTAWFGTRKAQVAVRATAPFDNTGGFGHQVARANKNIRNSWVFKRGRLAGSKAQGAHFKALKKSAKKQQKARRKKK